MTTQTKDMQMLGTPPIMINAKWSKQLPLINALIITDSIAILIGFWLAYFIRFEIGITWFYQPEGSQISFYRHLVFFLTPIWIVIFSLFGLYNFKKLFAGMREYADVFNACTMSIMAVILISFFDDSLIIARAWVILSWLIISFMVASGRFLFRRVVHQMRIKGHFTTRMLIVGANEEGRIIAAQLNGNLKAGIEVKGFVDEKLPVGNETVAGLEVLGNIGSISRVINQHNIQEVIIVSTALSREKLLGLFQALTENDVSVRMSSGLYELMTTGVQVQEVGNVPLLSINKVRLTGGDLILKRLLDLIGAAVALTIFMPLMLIIAIAIRLDSSGPIFYRRRVVGVGGKEFDAFKFRTMVVDADAHLTRNPNLRRKFEQNYKLKDDPRVTRIGRFIRSTSLDELPQLFNVVLGQMSLVGPRMITSPERVYYGNRSLNLSTVKPGITGLWQVSGRSDVSYEDRVRLDMHYIRNYSIWFDIYLLWQTIPAVLLKRGAY